MTARFDELEVLEAPLLRLVGEPEAKMEVNRFVPLLVLLMELDISVYF